MDKENLELRQRAQQLDAMMASRDAETGKLQRRVQSLEKANEALQRVVSSLDIKQQKLDFARNVISSDSDAETAAAPKGSSHSGPTTRSRPPPSPTPPSSGRSARSSDAEFVSSTPAQPFRLPSKTPVRPAVQQSTFKPAAAKLRARSPPATKPVSVLNV